MPKSATCVVGSPERNWTVAPLNTWVLSKVFLSHITEHISHLFIIVCHEFVKAKFCVRALKFSTMAFECVYFLEQIFFYLCLCRTGRYFSGCQWVEYRYDVGLLIMLI